MQPLEIRIDYKFRNSLLLAEALTHPSLAYESHQPHFDNQRLEFLGDAVLQLLVTEELFSSFTDFPEGKLTKARAEIVSRRALARFALEIQLGDYILLGNGEVASGGRKKVSTLADAFEALLAAMYLDGGLGPPRKLILHLIKNEMATVGGGLQERNPKGELQEYLQALHPETPCYRVVSESGPDHRRVFQSEVRWCGVTLAAGKGKSKKEAEARAAGEALRTRAWENLVKI